jgi:hypothetical protein
MSDKEGLEAQVAKIMEEAVVTVKVSRTAGGWTTLLALGDGTPVVKTEGWMLGALLAATSQIEQTQRSIERSLLAKVVAESEAGLDQLQKVRAGENPMASAIEVALKTEPEGEN